MAFKAKVQKTSVLFLSLVAEVSPGIEGGLDVELSSSISSASSSCLTFEYPVAAGATDAGSDMLLTTIELLLRTSRTYDDAMLL